MNEQWLAAKLEAAEARLKAVRALHAEYRDDAFTGKAPWCAADGRAWPCATVRALDADEPYVERITGPTGDEQERGGDTDLQATIAALIEAGDMRVPTSAAVLIDGKRFRQAWIRDVT